MGLVFTVQPMLEIFNKWQHLSVAPQTVAFPQMELMAGDREPSIIRGAGEISFATPNGFRFKLEGVPDDVGYLLRQLNRQRANPYDGLMRFRLVATSDDSTRFSAGWTIPTVREEEGVWTCEGSCDGLMFEDKSWPETTRGQTGAQFIIPSGHAARIILSRFVRTAGEDEGFSACYEHMIADNRLHFHFDEEKGLFTIWTDASDLLPLTYTEGWLGEPMRILFGQMIYPRMIVRRFSSGEARITVSRSPAWRTDSQWTALWDHQNLTGSENFWQLYGDLLTFVARAKGSEYHKMTSLYEEVIMGSGGSRWVWALTFASAIEGLIRMLCPKGHRRSDADDKSIQALSKHIDNWKPATGTDREVATRLKASATGAVQRSAEVTPRYVLGRLRAKGVVTKKESDAWEKVRHSVMHGNLVSPYSSEEDDGLLLSLASLMHALTREIVSSMVSFD